MDVKDAVQITETVFESGCQGTQDSSAPILENLPPEVLDFTIEQLTSKYPSIQNASVRSLFSALHSGADTNGQIGLVDYAVCTTHVSTTFAHFALRPFSKDVLTMTLNARLTTGFKWYV